MLVRKLRRILFNRQHAKQRSLNDKRLAVSSYSSLSPIQPHDVYVLHEATLKAAVRSSTLDEADRHGLADAVFEVALSGYARSLDGTLDPDALAEAAVVRFRSGIMARPGLGLNSPLRKLRRRPPMDPRGYRAGQ